MSIADRHYKILRDVGVSQFDADCINDEILRLETDLAEAIGLLRAKLEVIDLNEEINMDADIENLLARIDAKADK